MGVEGLDSCSAWLPRLFLPRRLSFPYAGASQLHESRHCANLSQQCKPQAGAQSLLCSHRTFSHFNALHGREWESRPKKLQEYGRRILWLSVGASCSQIIQKCNKNSYKIMPKLTIKGFIFK